MSKTAWHLITGEYPPALGGVADYTRSIAQGLAAAGDEVHVWAPGPRGSLIGDAGVVTHPLPDVFGPRSLKMLSAGLSADGRAKRLLVQYVPHAFGLKGMNVLFSTWLATLRRHAVWVMFHEVAFPWGRSLPWRHNVLGGVTRVMAASLATRADRLFISVPAWTPTLNALLPRACTTTWLPIPSNVPSQAPAADVARVRAGLRREGEGAVIGHFGTYGEILAPLLVGVFDEILASTKPRNLLLLGRGGPEFARKHLKSPRVIAPGPLGVDEIATHLAACDVVVQPFVDGVSSRRTTVMASLALGVPIVTNQGVLSEDLWAESRAVALAREPSAHAIAAVAEDLLGDLSKARELGRRGQALYEREFSLAHAIATLRAS